MALTGNLPLNIRPLTALEKQVSDLMHPATVDGDQHVNEAGASFLDDEEEEEEDATFNEEEAEVTYNEIGEPTLEYNGELVDSIDLCMEEYYAAHESTPDKNDYADLFGVEPQPSTSSQGSGGVYQGVRHDFLFIFILAFFQTFLNIIYFSDVLFADL